MKGGGIAAMVSECDQQDRLVFDPQNAGIVDGTSLRLAGIPHKACYNFDFIRHSSQRRIVSTSVLSASMSAFARGKSA